MFNANSGKATPVNLIPAGELAFVNIGATVKASKATNGLYFNLELTVLGGPYKGRKVFEILPFPADPRNSEKWIEMGATNLCRLFEVAAVFIPGEPETYEQFNDLVKIPDNATQAQAEAIIKDGANKMAFEINGLTAAVKIKIEEGKDGFADKNKVGEWLSSNPASGGHKKFLELQQNKELAAESARGGAMRPAGSPKKAGAAGGAPAKTGGGATPPWLKKKAAEAPATNAATAAEQEQGADAAAEKNADAEAQGSTGEPEDPDNPY